jgi:hypothetical protein
MIYEDVKIGFYMYTHPLGGRGTNKWKYYYETILLTLIRLCSFSNITHCHIQIGNNSMVALMGMDATFASIETVNSFLGEPDILIDIGNLEIDVEGIDKIISGLFRGTPHEIICWFLFTRWFGVKKPKTCATLICEILQLCGHQIKTCVSPAELYREVRQCNS